MIFLYTELMNLLERQMKNINGAGAPVTEIKIYTHLFNKTYISEILVFFIVKNSSMTNKLTVYQLYLEFYRIYLIF